MVEDWYCQYQTVARPTKLRLFLISFNLIIAKKYA